MFIKPEYKKNIYTIMKYNTELNKHILLPVEVKERLDKIIVSIIKERITKGETKLRVSYSDAINFLLEKNDM
jgi:hypothetical protein